ncbi:fungal-specific transcription factor domain-containing protein [Mariannaea sp. PMI_226]|nr:fungal-specific transcription factor domain-containing protein [Mariannaea sp. PMI_226]
MPGARGSRSRDGCSNCRRRKRRCDESKPVCLTCRRTGVECIYPVPGSASNPLKFVVSVSSDHHSIPIARRAVKPNFLHLFSGEMPTFCPDIGVADTQNNIDGNNTQRGSWPVSKNREYWENVHLSRSIPPHLLQFNARLCGEASWAVEVALMQYYAEVVSSSKVYVQTDRNLFRSSVMPRVLLNQGPLFFTVLAMSAAEWGQKVVAGVADGQDYKTLSARYKVRALHELQHCLHMMENSEENLLTCVLLASLEIAEGSQPTWLRHLQGALALLDTFSTRIDSSVATFALQYFRFRYILMETTQPKWMPPTELHLAKLSHGSYDDELNRLAEVEYSPIHRQGGSEKLIDEHIGCSMEMVDIIDRISALSLTPGKEGQDMSVEQRHMEYQTLECRIARLSPQTNNKNNEYLVKSAMSFQLAAQIYLQLTCLNASIMDQSIQDYLHSLLTSLSQIIIKGQIRRSFPMWPLFIAGCTCSSDEHRNTVLGLFSILNSQWPISNISAVENAVRAVWHTRDLSIAPPTGKQDWQEIIHRFGWKLSLS